MMYPETSTTDYSLPYGNTKDKPKELSVEQQQVLDAMRNGWRLFQNHQTHKFFMKKETPTPPFRTLIGTLYKPTIQTLIHARLIKKDSTRASNDDYHYILKGNNNELFRGIEGVKGSEVQGD